MGIRNGDKLTENRCGRIGGRPGQRVRERMRRELGDPVFEAWIGPLSLESFDRDELKIGAAKPFVRNWVANHYVARIEARLPAPKAPSPPRFRS